MQIVIFIQLRAVRSKVCIVGDVSANAHDQAGNRRIADRIHARTAVTG